MFDKQPRKALLLGVMTILMWSTVSTGFEIALSSLVPLQLIVLGLSFASLLLGIYLLISGEWKKEKKIEKKDIYNVLAQGTCLFCYYFFLFSAYALLPAQIAQPINATWAFILVFLGAWILKQKLSRGELLGMLFAYVGVLIIAVGGAQSSVLSGQINIFGIMHAIACTFFMAGYWIINNQCQLSHRVSLFLGFFIADMCGIIVLLITSPSWENVSFLSVGASFYLALFEWTIPFITWTMALKLTNSISTISSLTFFVPFLSLIWVSLILGETIIASTLAGLVFIVSGTIILQRSKKNA